MRLTLEIGDAPAGHGGHLAPIAVPGLGAVGEAPILDGRATIDLPAISGAVLRIV